VSGSLHGKVIFITGASSGIGAATARACTRQGALTALAARRVGRLESLAEELGTRSSLAIGCDVRERSQVHAALHATLERFGRLDGVVCNAGRGLYASVAEMDTSAWHELWAVNVQGALHVIQESIPLLERGGVFVAISSIVSEVAVPYMGGYSATKSALSALCDALRVEVAEQGIRVATVYPGSTETEFRAQALGAQRTVERRIVRVGPERVARAVVYALVSGQSRVWVTRRDRIAASLARQLPGLADWVLRRVFASPRPR
jgi:NAD(P)-dependent dehydrogenase (short-subunit alcohol dehydrogenase family)